LQIASSGLPDCAVALIMANEHYRKITFQTFLDDFVFNLLLTSRGGKAG